MSNSELAYNMQYTVCQYSTGIATPTAKQNSPFLLNGGGSRRQYMRLPTDVSHFKAKMHQIRFLASVRLSVRLLDGI